MAILRNRSVAFAGVAICVIGAAWGGYRHLTTVPPSGVSTTRDSGTLASKVDVLSQEAFQIGRSDASERQVGDRTIYRAAFQTSVDSKGGALQQATIVGNAQMVLSLVASSASGFEYSGVLKEVSLTLDESAGTEEFESHLKQSLESQFSFHVTPEGRVDTIAFPAGEVGSGGATLRGLVAALQFVKAKGKDPKAWTITESDNLGECSAEYRVTESQHYTKSATSYDRLAIAEAFSGQQNGAKPVASFEGNYVLDSFGLPQSSKVTQHLTLPIGGTGETKVTSSYRLDIVTRDRGGVRFATSETWKREPLAERPLKQGLARPPVAELRRVLGDADLSSLRKDMEKFIRAGDEDARFRVGEQMTALFELEPEQAAIAAGQLRQVSSPKEAQTILGALAATSRPEALSAIQDVASDQSYSEDTRSQAVTHLGIHESPNGATIEAIEKSLSDAKTPELRTTSLDSLGGAAGKLLKIDEDSADARRAVRTLSQGLAAATDQPGRITYLNALGNAGGSDAFASVRPQLTSDDELTRSMAVFSLRLVQGVEVDAMLVDSLLRDPGARVRGAAARAIRFRAFSDVLAAGMASSLKAEAEELVRVDALEFFLAFPTRELPISTEVLEWVSAHDASPQLRGTAEKALKG